LANKNEDSGNESEIGVVAVDLKEILSAPLKKSAQAMVRVADQYLPV
jgi:hypothetical protein